MLSTSGLGPALTKLWVVPAGTTTMSPALTSCVSPPTMALPTPDVNVRIWSTVWICFGAMGVEIGRQRHEARGGQGRGNRG